MLNFSLNQDINYSMLGKYKAVRAVITDYSCTLTLLMTLGLWVPAGGHLATARDTYCIR